MSDQPTYSATLDAVLSTQGQRLREATPSDTVRPEQSLDETLADAVQPHDRPVVRRGLQDFGEVLGEGGMGIVRVATQSALDRIVAVKSLRLDDPPPRVVQRLLQEAWVAGVLDHPNVLPVHDIVLDDDGKPHIVMKRVEGRPWTQFALDPELVRETFGARDPLEWNLRVFLQVCNAAEYAHEFGILHRDLKLDNVMIGRFGEVLVLDWGVAVALDDRWGDRIPLARNEFLVAGTPRYMAPEMAIGDGPALSPATDVYLLGGVLHHVLTGRPPHQGDKVEDVLRGIPGLEVELLGVPRALQRIVRTALANDPAERFQTVASLHQAVDAFLDHRGSLRIALRAERALTALEDGIEGEVDRRELHNRFGAARFGFEQALHEWPANPQAQEGQRKARILMARWELDHDEPGTAAAFLDGMEDAPEDLAAAVAVERAARAAGEAELHALRQDLDQTIGRRTRVGVAATVGGLWVIAPIVYGIWRPEVTWWWMGATSVALFVGLGILMFWARETLSRTWLNRMSIGTLLIVPLLQGIFDICFVQLDLEPIQALTTRPLIWFAVALMYVVTVERRFWPVPVAFGIAGVVSTTLPSLHPWAIAAANLVLLAVALGLWGRLEDLDRARPERRVR